MVCAGEASTSSTLRRLHHPKFADLSHAKAGRWRKVGSHEGFYAQFSASRWAVQQQGLNLSSTSGVSIGCWAVEGGGGEHRADAIGWPL